MDLKSYLNDHFGKDLFSHLKGKELLEERMRVEKHIEDISADIGDIQEKIQQLILSSKGKAEPTKLLNIAKIKTLRLESEARMQEAEGYLKELQVMLLIEAMREHHKDMDTNKFVQKIMNTDVEHLHKVLFTEDVKQAIQEGKLDKVKQSLKRTFAKEELPSDAETQDLLSTIKDLEKADDETAIEIASEKAKKIAESPIKRERIEE